MYQFDLNPIYREVKAVNEQMRTQAEAFKAGAEALEASWDSPTTATATQLEQAARLWEHAAHAFETAAARTLGHKKADRYEGEARWAIMAAGSLYALAVERFDWVKPNEHVRSVIVRAGHDHVL